MLQRLMKAMFVVGIMATGACAVDDATGGPETAVAESRIEAVPQDVLMDFKQKPFWTSWENFCEKLNGLEIRLNVGGCTTSTMYENCHRGAISGTCHCDQTITRSGTNCD